MALDLTVALRSPNAGLESDRQITKFVEVGNVAHGWPKPIFSLQPSVREKPITFLRLSVRKASCLQ